MSGAAPDPAATLVGLDGLEGRAESPPGAMRRGSVPLTLDPAAAERMRAEIARAGGREVCFMASVTAERVVVDPRAVARGNHAAVLAAARDEPEGGVMIHNHPSGELAPSDADLGVAARLWEEGLGTAITDNAVTTLHVVVEPPAPRVVRPLDPTALADLVAPGGPLASRHPGYEDREGQRQMIRAVAERYNEGGVLLVEAGTGTGKSLAYLLPAARWALDNDERTVIATATINLQAQLVEKDLPLVARLLEEEERGAAAGEGGAGADEAAAERTLSWALVKGRGNYISIRRLRLAEAGAPELFESDRSRELEELRRWVETTDDGSLADLPAVPSPDVWEEVRSDPDICLRSRCPHFQECFYQRSRRRAARARILVANHHLLFTDLAVRRATDNWTAAAVLPAWRRLVLDEAHNVEDAATSHLGVEVSRSGLYRTLARLDRRGKGVLAALQDEVKGMGDFGSALRRRVEEDARPAVEAARAALDLFLDEIEPLVAGTGVGEGEAVRIVAPPADADPGGGGGSASLLREQVISEPVARPEIAERLHHLLDRLHRLGRELGGLRHRLEEREQLPAEVEGRLLDLRSGERRISAAAVALKVVLEPGARADDHVRWLGVRGKGRRRNLVLAAAPIELGGVLGESLWGRAETVVLSSATLTTRGRFDFLRGRLGLTAGDLVGLERPPELREAVVPSPFDFSTQTVLVVPTDLPPLRDTDAFDRATAGVIARLAGHSGGGLVALFTSYRSLRAVAGALRNDPAAGAWPLFVQGEDDRTRLLADFVAHGDAILLGTASFWEGVDVPGDPLRALVIQKLPFRVPSEPVTAARVEALEARGANAFWDYSLPLAALRLKQGFGRLVRNRDDRGAVVLLDDRILRKRYGRYLRDSLPPAPLRKGPLVEVDGVLRRFYRDPERG